jgi:hypothetical protein
MTDFTMLDAGTIDWSADETALVIREREAFRETLYAIPHGTTHELERTGRQIFREACDQVGVELSSDSIHRLDDQIAAANVSGESVSGVQIPAETARAFYASAAEIAASRQQAIEAGEISEEGEERVE